MTPNDRPGLRQWLALGAALVLLNAALTFHPIWPTPWIEVRSELSIEIAALVLVLSLCAALARPPGRLAVRVLTALAVLFALGRYAAVMAHSLYGRPVNLYWDSQHLPEVAAMLAEVAPPAVLAIGAIAIAVGLVALTVVLRWALGCVADGVREPRTRRALGAVAASLVTLYVVGAALEWPVRHRFSVPVSGTYGEQLVFLVDAYTGRRARELPLEPLEPSALKGVAGSDVLLAFLESYGATTYDAPAIAARLAESRAALDAAAADTGRRVVSAFVESPTFGGNSWLAHATLMSGVEVRDPGAYDLLLTQDRETLSTRFAAAGYRVVGLMPGLRNAWPEGGFYRFDKLYGERELDYRGPDFGWWRIPDQYAIAKLDALELARAERPPLFAFFATINTHVPFRPTPPLQPDWKRLLSGDPYDADATAASLAAEPEWTNFTPAYADSFAYTFSYFADYLRARPAADLVLILVGDHQPAASVAGVGARWDVPVHVIASHDGLARALLDAGFTPGVALGAQQPPVAKMAELTTLLLRAFAATEQPKPAPYGSGADTPTTSSYR